jgi:hypothetical protein
MTQHDTPLQQCYSACASLTFEWKIVAACGETVDIFNLTCVTSTALCCFCAAHCPASPEIHEPRSLGVPIPPLKASERPNFIIILTDDQGWDDISLHHPQKPDGRPEFVRTPNLDRFIQRGTLFDNYYVSPMCSHSRAALLTGREYPKSGTMLVNGGEASFIAFHLHISHQSVISDRS